MKKAPILNKKNVRKEFLYIEGSLKRLFTRGNQKKGKIAGGVHHTGYIYVRFCGLRYLLHRVVWVYFNGEVKRGMTIDHIDRNPLNNNIENLRLATRSENFGNQSAYKIKNKTSTFKGVFQQSKAKRIGSKNTWVSSIQNKNKRIFLGIFENEIDAAKAYNQSAKKLFGEFALLNEVD